MNTNELTIGLDLGDLRHHVCVLAASGEIIAEEVMPNTSACITAYAGRHPGATIIMETGRHSPWVSRLLEQCGHRVLVANARKLRAISQSHTKNDVEDARLLARLGRADPALLSPIKHRSKQGQRALLRIKVRESLVRSRVNQMNSVRFLLKSLGLAVPSGSKAMTFTRKLRPMLDAATCCLVEPLLTTIDTLNATIARLDVELEAFGRERYPATERLRQVPGVGPLTALAIDAATPSAYGSLTDPGSRGPRPTKTSQQNGEPF